MKTIIVLLLLSMIVCSQTEPDRSPAKSPGAGKSYQSGEANRNKSINNNFHKTQLKSLDTSKVKSAENEFENLLSMSKQAYQKDDIAKSITYLRQALALIAEDATMDKARLEVEKKLAFYLNAYSFKLMDEVNYDEAELLFKEALVIRRRIHEDKDHPDLATSINGMAYFYHLSGQFSKAQPLLQEALDMRKRLYRNKLHIDLAFSINNMAIFLATNGSYSVAVEMGMEALKTAEIIFKNEENPAIAFFLNNVAYIYDLAGSYTKAESFFMKALEMYRRIYNKRDRPDLARCLNNIGLLHKKLGNYSESEQYLSEALHMYKNIYSNKMHPDLSRCLNNYAITLEEMGRYTEAENYYKEALKTYRQIFKDYAHPDFASNINNLALFLNRRGKYKEAESLLKETLEMHRVIYKNKDHPGLAAVINNMAVFLWARGKYSDAEPLYKESLEMNKMVYKDMDHPDFVRSIYNMFLYLNSQDRYLEALSHLLQWNEMQKRLLKNYIYFLSEKEKEALLSTIYNQYEIFNSVAVNHYNDDANVLKTMYTNQLLIKGIISQSKVNLRRKIDQSGRPELIKTYDNWLEVNSLIADFYSAEAEELNAQRQDIKELEKQANKLEKELSVEIENIFEERNAIDLTWLDIQTKLKTNEAAIEIVRFDYYKKHKTDLTYYAALILTTETKDHPELVLLENGNELEGSLFKEYKDYIASSQYQEKGEENSDEGKLYDSFWGKIAEKIKGKTRVYLSSDGVYNQINLNSFYNPKTKKHVIDEIEIVLLTNTRELAMKKEERKYENTAELFGFPNYDLGAKEQKEIVQDYDLKRKRLLEGARLTELPGTKIEIEESGNILKKNKWVVKEYLGDNALEENLKKINSPRLLHIATHGVFLEEEDIKREREYTMGFIRENQRVYYDNPLLRSALFLSGANRSRKGINVEGVEDGVFTGYEAQNLNLMNTELVILSACETGLGVLKSGEGVYGLQRAFRVAGAENIIMSLWKVSDEATKDLILSFYKKWTSGKSVKEAFREAQRELRDKYPGAYYWAAFVLIGN